MEEAGGRRLKLGQGFFVGMGSQLDVSRLSLYDWNPGVRLTVLIGPFLLIRVNSHQQTRMIVLRVREEHAPFENMKIPPPT